MMGSRREMYRKIAARQQHMTDDKPESLSKWAEWRRGTSLGMQAAVAEKLMGEMAA